ncbi:MAG: T9SS type A sorting domain-containing protein [Bacteroidota bacterium]
MKRILYVFALLAVSAFTAEAQQRVEISTARIPQGKHVTFVGAEQQAFSPAVAQEILTKKRSIPEMLLVDPVRVGFITSTDTSDSAFIITSKTDQTKRSLTGIFDFPYDLSTVPGLEYTIMTPVQFVPGLNGDLLMDTVAFAMFKLPADPLLTKDMLLFVVTTDVDMSAPTFKGLNVNFDQLTIVGDQGGYTISADTINTRYDETLGLKRVVIGFEQPIAIPAGKSFGFVIYPLDAVEKFRMYGGRQWQLKANETYGSMLRRSNDGVDSVSTFFSSLFYGNQQPFATDYPALAGKGIAINYDFFVGGMFTEITSVEQESSTANSFALEQNVPNPAVGEVKISFSVAQNSHVTLRVYNTLGQQVAELANGNYSGKYNATFNTGSLPNGSYIYVLNANGQTISRTLQVVR